MTYTTTPPAATSRAAASPAGTTHGPATRRGQDHDFSRGAWKHPVSQAAKYESCHLSRRGMAWLVAFVTFVLVALFWAWLAGGGAHKAVASVAHAFEEAAR